MNKEFKREWVKALTSGEYKQGKEALRYRQWHCCLGVARHAIPKIDDLNDSDTRNNGWLEGNELRALGITNQVQRELAQLNDEGVPFDMIAGLIDEAL